MQNKKRFHIDFWIGTSIAVAILLGIFLAYPLMSLLIRAFRDSSSGAFTMNLARDGEFDTPLVIHTGDEFEQIAVSYNQMLGDIHQLMDDKQELARQSALSQIQQLEAQFNPHFLFNTLELIKYMSRIAPDKAGDVIVGLSNLLRDSLDNSISKVTLQQDVEYTKNYLLIQKYRFGDKLAYDFDIAPEASRCMAL